MNWGRIKNQLIARAIARFPALADRVIRSYSARQSDEIPWTLFHKPLSKWKLR